MVGGGPENAGRDLGFSSVAMISMIVGPPLRPGTGCRRSTDDNRLSATDI